jgi:hypothetical protein
MSSALLSVILVCNRRILSGPDFKSWSQIGGAAQMCSDLCPNINYQYASQVATVAGQLEIGLSDVAGNSAKCYIHFDRSACHVTDFSGSVSNVKKINHGLPLCQNVNGVYNVQAIFVNFYYDTICF